MGLLARISPEWAYKREAARARLARAQYAVDRMSKARAYDAAGKGRRLGGWLATDGGPAGASGFVLSVLRARSRDLSQNNPWFVNAMNGIESETVGAGIVGKVSGPRGIRGGDLSLAWKEWADSTDCDADGRLNFYGLQALVMRTVAMSGEVLIRRRWRRTDNSLAIPMQLQVIEPDMIADDRMGIGGPGNVKSGIAFDRRGKRTAYHLYKEHPVGNSIGSLSQQTIRVPAEDIIHVYRSDRPGQIRGVPWAAPVITRLRLLDDYDDAALERARVAACFAAFVTEPDDLALPQKTTTNEGTEVQELERLEPGIVEHLTPGREVSFGTPPADTGYSVTTTHALRAVAAGMHIPYELLTGDYSKVNFTSGRMGKLAQIPTVDKWRWNMLIPHFCDGTFAWFLTAATARGIRVEGARIAWTPPRSDMVDPTREVAALQQRVRGGFITWAEAAREQGYDPDEMLDEIQEYNSKFDDMGIVLDTDPRIVTKAGQVQSEGQSNGETTATNEETDQESGTAGAD